MSLFPQFVINGTDFITSVMNLKNLKIDQTFSKLGQPINKTDWTTHSIMEAVAFYSPSENSVSE